MDFFLLFLHGLYYLPLMAFMDLFTTISRKYFLKKYNEYVNICMYLNVVVFSIVYLFLLHNPVVGLFINFTPTGPTQNVRHCFSYCSW